jgi:hypothetical protein
LISSYAFRTDVDGDDIPLVSPRRFKTSCSPHLGVGICDMLWAAIRLLLLGSAGGVRPAWAVSTPSSSRSGVCLTFVTRSVKCLRRLSAEVV